MAHAALNEAEPPEIEAKPSGPSSGRGAARSPLLELAIGAAWLLGLAAVLQILAVLLGGSPLAAALAGAVIADIAGARAGVRWDDPLERAAPSSTARLARRIGLGAALGALAALLPLGVAVLLGWATVEAGQPSMSFGFALVRAAALAVQSELLLTGIPLAAAARAGVPARFALVFAALAHGAVIALDPVASAASIALSTAAGALFAAAWWRGGGAFTAIAAHAGFVALAGAGLRGALLDATWTSGALTAGARAFGRPAWLAAAVLAILAVLVLRFGAARLDQRPAGSTNATSR